MPMSVSFLYSVGRLRPSCTRWASGMIFDSLLGSGMIFDSSSLSGTSANATPIIGDHGGAASRASRAHKDGMILLVK